MEHYCTMPQYRDARFAYENTPLIPLPGQSRTLFASFAVYKSAFVEFSKRRHDLLWDSDCT